MLENNRDLANARLDRILQRYSLRIAEDEFRPRLTLGSNVQRALLPGYAPMDSAAMFSGAALRIRTGGEFTLGWSGTRSGGTGSEPYGQALTLSFSQPLLRGAGVRIATTGLRSARRAEQRNLLAFRDTVARAVAGVVRLYRAYWQAERNVESVERAMLRAEQRHETNRFLVAAGRMAERELVRNRGALKQLELGIAAAQDAVDAMRLSLVDVLDVPTGTRFALAETFDPADIPPPADPAASLELALEHRADYRLAHFIIEDAEDSLLLARNQRRWDLGLNASTNLAGTGVGIGSAAGALESGGYALGLSLNVPVGRISRDAADVALLRATLGLERARTEHADLLHRIEVTVRYAVRAVQSAHQRVLLARESRALAEENVEIEGTNLASGLSSNFEVIAAEDALLAASNQETDAVIGYLDALTELDETLGTTLRTWGIDVAHVDRPGTRFQPADPRLRKIMDLD